MTKVSNIAVVLQWYKQQYENEGKKQCCKSENNSYACKKWKLHLKFEFNNIVISRYGGSVG